MAPRAGGRAAVRSTAGTSVRAGVAVAALVLAALGTGCGPAGCGDRTGSATRDRPEAAAAQSPGTTLPLRSGGRAGADEPSARPEERQGTVIRVRDGDSLVVSIDGSATEVRLDGVDCPELVQAFGRRARRFTSDLALGRTVRLAVRGRDKYERELVEAFLPDGRSLNRELVSAGFAWWFRRYSTDRDLERREAEARTARRGLWIDRDPRPPWEFREHHPRR